MSEVSFFLSHLSLMPVWSFSYSHRDVFLIYFTQTNFLILIVSDELALHDNARFPPHCAVPVDKIFSSIRSETETPKVEKTHCYEESIQVTHMNVFKIYTDIWWFKNQILADIYFFLYRDMKHKQRSLTFVRCYLVTCLSSAWLCKDQLVLVSWCFQKACCHKGKPQSAIQWTNYATSALKT